MLYYAADALIKNDYENTNIIFQDWIQPRFTIEWNRYMHASIHAHIQNNINFVLVELRATRK